MAGSKAIVNEEIELVYRDYRSYEQKREKFEERLVSEASEHAPRVYQGFDEGASMNCNNSGKDSAGQSSNMKGRSKLK